MFDSYKESMGFHLARANQKLINRLAREFRKYNITPEQWALLNILRSEDGLSQKDLTDKMGKDQTTITRALDNLNKKNLIIRQSSTDDRRVYLIFMTSEGANLMNILVPIARNTMSDIFKGFSQEEINQLRTLLDRLYDAIE